MTSATVAIVKHCPDCGEDKPLDAFYRQYRCQLGRAVRCKPCDNKHRGRVPKNKQRAEPVAAVAPDASELPRGHDPRWPRWAHPLARHIATGAASVAALIGQGRGLGMDEEKARSVISWLANERLVQWGEFVEITDEGREFAERHRAVGVCRECDPCTRSSGDRRAMRRGPLDAEAIAVVQAERRAASALRKAAVSP